uniref:uncharacterized protein LOC120336279 isoform X1 n=1 Tax=Styela clava TaxID=7725 RepID=UPI00193A724A|nr:uncharacterized protein LOC120336279 isoform X1 [Styela clava]
MDVSSIADATNNLIVYLATIIEIAHYTLVIYGVRNDWGVKLGRGAFPDSLLICTILGMFGACGGGFVKNAATFVRKQWNHETVKSIHLAIVTKLSLLFSLLHNLQLLGILPISFNTVVLLQLTVMFLISASSKFGVNFDPFHRIEKIITSCVIDYSAHGGAEEEKSPQKKAVEEKSPEKKKDSLKKKE